MPLTEEQKLPGDKIYECARRIVQDDVYCQVGTFMDYCIKRVFEGDDDNPITEDDVNFGVDPSDWDASRLNEYIKDTFSTTWEEITGQPWELAQRDDVLNDARTFVEEWIDNAPVNYDEEDEPLPNPRQAQAEAHDSDPVDEWGVEALHRFIMGPIESTWNVATGYDIDETIVAIEYDLEEEIDQVREYIRDNDEPREPYEWWAVSSWLESKLKNRGEIIIDLGGGLSVWGRCTTGQAIYMDGDIQEIAEQLLKDRGEI